MTKKPGKRRRVKPAYSNTGDLLAKAKDYHQKGLLDRAKKIYQRILSRAPNNPDTLHFLGMLLHEQGQYTSAVSHIRRSIEIQPDYVAAHSNLGNVLRKQGRLIESEQAFRKAIEIKPDHAFSYNNLGITLKDQGKLDESASAYQKAISLVPDYAEAYHNLGNVLIKKDDLNGALTAFRKAIILKPSDAKPYEFLGKALYAAGRVNDAIVLYEEWLKQSPENPVARHMLIACTGENVPERASDEYVKKTFDSFSDKFDQVLEKLDYRAPQLVFNAIQSTLSDSTDRLDILDAGCGTGLCAPYFKPYARRLEGVDLSPGMLSKARCLDLYDELTAAELTAYLLGNPASYDLIISADTLIYFGALDKFFLAVSSALHRGGRLVFTVEHLQADDTSFGYRLNAHGRYSHTQNYVSEMLSLAGLSVVSTNEDILRNENKQPVKGLIIVATK
jgi:predicted TPR repeat methyltransferase